MRRVWDQVLRAGSPLGKGGLIDSVASRVGRVGEISYLLHEFTRS